jgi:hypothetical protein
MRPKSSGVTSRSSISSLYCSNLAGSISGSEGSTYSPVSGSRTVPSSIVSTMRCASRRSEVAGLAVDLHARVLRCAGLLLVGGEQGVLEGGHQLLRWDALLGGKAAHGLQDLA